MSRLEPAHGHLALVVFIDRTECRWLRGLRSGFRHCFAVIRYGSTWIACDPLRDRMEICPLQLPTSFDLPAFYVEQGHTVLVGKIGRHGQPRPILPSILTCVAVVQRLIGVHAPWTLTPWQLYHHLTRKGWLTPGSAREPSSSGRFEVDRERI